MTTVETDTARELGDDRYGYCPKCGAVGYTRERRPNGNDKCIHGHEYPSAQATAAPAPVPLFAPTEAHQIVAVGDNPILRDVARAHEDLVHVRTAVAGAMAIAHPNAKGPGNMVMAVSLMSAGSAIADQMVVFSPGGDKARNAREVRARLKLALEQLDQLIDGGAFDG